MSSPDRNSLSQLHALQAELGRLVIEECAAQRKAHRESWALPVREREKRGKCISGLRLTGRLEEGILEFRLQRNDSDFREDDLLLLNRGNPGADGGIGVIVFRETHDRLFLRLQQPDQRVDPDGEWVLDLNFIDLEKTYRGAIEALGQSAIGRERILPLLAGELTSQLDLAEFDNSCDEAIRSGHDDSQAEAIATAVATDVCSLIQGPPGTGKTRALAQVVKQRAARGERILVTSFTHRAIHNALNAIEAAQPDCPVAKVGWPVYDPELRVTQYGSFSQLPFGDSASAYVIGATPFSLRSKRLRNVEFDTVIFDEASQLTLPLAVMGMLGGRSYLFFGDDRQLPPVLQTVEADIAHHFSIFGRLRGRGNPEAMLTTTYRLNRELTVWPAEAFYSGNLTAHENNAGRRLPLQTGPASHQSILDPQSPLVYVEMPAGDDKTRCLEEALLVAELLEEVHRCGLSLAQAGVVTPFRRQARQIRQLLLSRARVPMESIYACTIDTVERMQGQERELVICSLTASDPLFIRDLRGFLYQPQRLNVTATRARSKFILLASRSFLTAESIDSDFEDQKAVLQSLRDKATVIPWSRARGALRAGDSEIGQEEIAWPE
jgi:DNA replication ATP-dependent helicase Dna2